MASNSCNKYWDFFKYVNITIMVLQRTVILTRSNMYYDLKV